MKLKPSDYFKRYRISVHRVLFILGPDECWWLAHPLPDLIFEGAMEDYIDWYYVVTKHVPAYESVVQINEREMEMCTGFSLERIT
jgi:hypothetical protein